MAFAQVTFAVQIIAYILYIFLLCEHHWDFNFNLYFRGSKIVCSKQLQEKGQGYLKHNTGRNVDDSSPSIFVSFPPSLFSILECLALNEKKKVVT